MHYVPSDWLTCAFAISCQSIYIGTLVFQATNRQTGKFAKCMGEFSQTTIWMLHECPKCAGISPPRGTNFPVWTNRKRSKFSACIRSARLEWTEMRIVRWLYLTLSHPEALPSYGIRQSKITNGMVLASLGEKGLRKRDGRIGPVNKALRTVCFRYKCVLQWTKLIHKKLCKSCVIGTKQWKKLVTFSQVPYLCLFFFS